MTRKHSPLSYAPAFLIATWLAGCVLVPKSSGELDTDGAGSATSDPDDGGDGGSGAVTEGHPEDAIPPVAQWFHTVPTAGITWACSVVVDPTGRIAMSWRVEDEPGFPLGRTGIDLLEPDGTLITSTEAAGKTFTSLAFASDGTLRARGVTALGGSAYVQWVTALDDELDEAWIQVYPGEHGNGQCDWGETGVLVDHTDHVITVEVDTPTSLRRHLPDGALEWERNVDGGGGYRGLTIALAPDDSVFHAVSHLYDDHAELDVYKYLVNGDTEWVQTVEDEIQGLWAASDGGVFVFTKDFYSRERSVHRLGADGSDQWSSSVTEDPLMGIIAASADELGLYSVIDGSLRRTNPTFDEVWSVPYGGDNWLNAAAVANDDQVFVLAGQGVEPSYHYWVTVLAMP